MKKLLVILSFAAITGLGCGPTIYKTQDFESKTASHKIVAILPGEVSISLRPNQMKKMSISDLNQSEEINKVHSVF